MHFHCQTHSLSAALQITASECYQIELRGSDRFLPYIALGTICVLWGTTYLAIRIAVQSIPPLGLVAFRFVASGLAVMGLAALARAPKPAKKDILRSAFYGILALGLGNGALSYAELWIPSALVALIVTVTPFWMVGLEVAIPGGQKPAAATLLGLAIGLSGTVTLLGWGSSEPVVGTRLFQAFVLLQLGCASWALASVLQRRHAAHVHPLWGGAIQQLAAGLAFAIPAARLGQLNVTSWSQQSLAATAYLIVFGSIAGYTCYVYALQTLPVPLISIHSYVNPLIAVWLGWWLGGELVTVRQIVAAGIILTGVAVVKRSEWRAARACPAAVSVEASSRSSGSQPLASVAWHAEELRSQRPSSHRHRSE